MRRLALAVALAGAPAAASDLPLEICAALGLPSALTPYEEAAVALPPGALDWGALLMLEGHDLPLRTFAEGGTLRIGVPPVTEARARLVMGARGADGALALCPPHRVRIEAPPAREGAWLDWTGQVATLTARSGGVAEEIGTAPILPEDLAEAVLGGLADAQAAYGGLTDGGRRALDAYATFQLREGHAEAGLSSLRYLRAQAAAAEPISAPGPAPAPAPAIWRPAEHPARLWRAQVGGLTSLEVSCPGSVEELIRYREAVHDAEIWQGGNYADFKRGLEATGTFLVSAGVGLAGGAGAAEAVNTGLSTGLAAQGIISDWAIGMVPSDLAGLEPELAGGPIFEDSPPDRRTVRLDPITLKTRSRGWDVTKAALDSALAVIGPFAGKLKLVEAGEATEAARIAGARTNIVTADQIVGDLANLREAGLRDGGLVAGGFETVWGIEEGKRLGEFYSGVQSNVTDSAISYPPITCKLDIAESDIWTSEVVELPGGNALRAEGPGDPQERDFVARRAGQGAVTVEIDPARLFVPDRAPTGTARLTVPEIRLTLTGPASIPGGGLGFYETSVENAAFPDLIGIDWDVVASGAVSWRAEGRSGALASMDECEPGGATILASPRGDFLEDSDAESRETRTLDVSVVVSEECDEEEEPAKEDYVALADLTSPARCMVDFSSRFDRVQVYRCETMASSSMSVALADAHMELTLSGGDFRLDGIARVSEVASPMTDLTRADFSMMDVISQLAGRAEAAAFAAADPVLYENLDPERSPFDIWRAFTFDGVLYAYVPLIDDPLADGDARYARGFLDRFVLEDTPAE